MGVLAGFLTVGSGQSGLEGIRLRFMEFSRVGRGEAASAANMASLIDKISSWWTGLQIGESICNIFLECETGDMGLKSKPGILRGKALNIEERTWAAAAEGLSSTSGSASPLLPRRRPA